MNVAMTTAAATRVEQPLTLGEKAKPFSVPGLYEMLPITDIRLTAIADPYAKPESWPIGAQQLAQYTKALEGDYRGWAQRDAVDKNIAAITARWLDATKGTDPQAATSRGLIELVPELEKLIDLLRSAEEKRKPVVGTSAMRNLSVDSDGVLTGEWHPTPMIRYQMFAKQTASPEVQQFARAMGTSAILVARDLQGQEWIQVQYRHPVKNFPHAGNPGCSPSGFFRPTPSGDQTAASMYARHLLGAADSFGDIGEREVASNLVREGREEIGLVRGLVNHRILGWAFDCASPHDDLLSVLTSKFLDRDAMTKMSLDHAEDLAAVQRKQGKDVHPHDFVERFAWIRGTPEVIEKFVVAAPHAPSTHLAGFLAYGLDLVRRKDGDAAAMRWIESTREKVSAAWEESSRKIETHYSLHPDQFFLNSHPREQGNLKKFIDSKAGIETSALEAEIPANSVPHSMLTRVTLQGDRSPELHREIVLRAAAMAAGVLHAPSLTAFDPRRTPEAQGLQSTPELLKGLGPKNMDAGTLDS